jgi:hypothetical protein
MLFNDNLAGSRLYTTNTHLRLLLIFFGGLIIFSSVVYWRSQLFLSQDAVDTPQAAAQAHRKLIKASQPTSQTERLKKELND